MPCESAAARGEAGGLRRDGANPETRGFACVLSSRALYSGEAAQVLVTPAIRP
jgi:hypothetical protein